MYRDCDLESTGDPLLWSSSWPQPQSHFDPMLLSTLPSCAILLNESSIQSKDSSKDYECFTESPKPPKPQRLTKVRCKKISRYTFRASITPLTNISTPYSHHRKMVEFEIIRKDGRITLQWEPFEGEISQNGVTMLTVEQGIDSLPPYPMEPPISFIYKSERRPSVMLISPGTSSPLKFIIPAVNVSAGDHIVVPGGSVEWITRQESRK